MTTYQHAAVDGVNIFYREAGNKDAPTIVLLHGFPTSSFMFRNLIPLLSETNHVIAPDYPGFGFSDAPSVDVFDYTFDHLASIMEDFLVKKLGLKKFSIYVQDYGAPIGYRIAEANPELIDKIIVQNGNAYLVGIGSAFDPMKPFWENRTMDTEKPVRALLTLETTKFQYLHGAKDQSKISPDTYTFDQALLDRPGNNDIQLNLLHDYRSNPPKYAGWHEFFRKKLPPMLIVWGKNDPFFTVAGAEAYLEDLPHADLHLLDTGHFALEEELDFIAGKMKEFLA